MRFFDEKDQFRDRFGQVSGKVIYRVFWEVVNSIMPTGYTAEIICMTRTTTIKRRIVLSPNPRTRQISFFRVNRTGTGLPIVVIRVTDGKMFIRNR